MSLQELLMRQIPICIKVGLANPFSIGIKRIFFDLKTFHLDFAVGAGFEPARGD